MFYILNIFIYKTLTRRSITGFKNIFFVNPEIVILRGGKTHKIQRKEKNCSKTAKIAFLAQMHTFSSQYAIYKVFV